MKFKLSIMILFLGASLMLSATPAPTPEALLDSAVIPEGQTGGLTQDIVTKGSWGPAMPRGPFWLEINAGGKALVKSAQSAESGIKCYWAIKKGFFVLSLGEPESGYLGPAIPWKSRVQVFHLIPIGDSFYSGEAMESGEVKFFNHNKTPGAAKRIWNGITVSPSALKMVQLSVYASLYPQDSVKNPGQFTLDIFSAYQKQHAQNPKIAHVGLSYDLLPPGKWLRVLGEKVTGGVKWLLVNTLLTSSDKGPEEAWVQASQVKALKPVDIMEALPTFKDFAFYLLPEKTKKEIDDAQWVVSPMKHRIDALEAAGKKGTKEYKDLYIQLETALATILRLDPRVEN